MSAPTSEPGPGRRRPLGCAAVPARRQVGARRSPWSTAHEGQDERPEWPWGHSHLRAWATRSCPTPSVKAIRAGADGLGPEGWPDLETAHAFRPSLTLTPTAPSPVPIPLKGAIRSTPEPIAPQLKGRDSVRRDVKPSSVGSTPGQGSRLGRRFGGAFATVGASSGSDAAGVGASSPAGAPSHSPPQGCSQLSLPSPLLLRHSLRRHQLRRRRYQSRQIRLREPEGIGVDQTSGDLYISAGFAHRVDKFEADGNSLFAFGMGYPPTVPKKSRPAPSPANQSPFTVNAVTGAMLANGSGVAVDPTSGDVYVVDRGYDRVMKYDPRANSFLPLAETSSPTAPTTRPTMSGGA